MTQWFRLLGRIIQDGWRNIPRHFPTIELDEFVLMPNHIHGIIILNDERTRRGLINQTPTKDWPMMKNPDTTLGKIIRAFKARTARAVHVTGHEDFRWQRGFYEHVIRSDADLHHIRQYIANNPMQWTLDEENPVNF